MGEYSGLHTNLRHGLLALGHDVTLASDGDGWKHFDGDVKISRIKKSNLTKNKYLNVISSKICNYIDLFDLYKMKSIFYGYDIVQFVNPYIFYGVWETCGAAFQIIKNNPRSFLLATGDDARYAKTIRKLRYSPRDYEISVHKIPFDGFLHEFIQKSFVKKINGVIATSYPYAEGYRNDSKFLGTIQMPINIDSIKYVPQNFSNGKIRIFHGLNRNNFKGTSYIREALFKIKETFPDKVEISIKGGIPYQEYLKVLENSNIVIDQARSYGYGMNAIYAMAMGKVVLSGNEPEAQKELGRLDIPVINITPSAEHIYDQLKDLIVNTNQIKKIGEKSREFVENFHDSRKVAQIYINKWLCAK